MKLVHAERLGEAFDSQLVIGVRESYGKTRGAPSLLIQFVKAMMDFQICLGREDKIMIIRAKSNIFEIKVINLGKIKEKKM